MKTMKQLVTTVAALSSGRDEDGMLISTPTVDRDGDRVMPEGVDLTNFKKNSPLMWAHDYRGIPIGVVTSINVGREGIKAWWRWLRNDEFAKRVKNAWDQGVARSASIGFRPIKTIPNDYGGHDILKWDLLELSLVPVPANPEATRMFKMLGLEVDSPVLLIDESSSWTPQSVAQEAVKNLERRWTDYSEGCEPILLIEEETLKEEQFMVDIDELNREIEQSILNWVSSVVSIAVRSELNYARCRIE